MKIQNQKMFKILMLIFLITSFTGCSKKDTVMSSNKELLTANNGNLYQLKIVMDQSLLMIVKKMI